MNPQDPRHRSHPGSGVADVHVEHGHPSVNPGCGRDVGGRSVDGARHVHVVHVEQGRAGEPPAEERYSQEAGQDQQDPEPAAPLLAAVAPEPAVQLGLF